MEKQERIFVDFLKTDDFGRLRFLAMGTQRDIRRVGLKLAEGIRMHVFSDDLDAGGAEDPLFAEGTVRRKQRECRAWVYRSPGGRPPKYLGSIPNCR